MNFRFYFLSVLLSLTLFSNGQEETSFSVGDFDFTILPDSASVKVMACDQTLVGEIEIPETASFNGKVYNVTMITSLGKNPEVTSVSIPKFVNSINSDAFRYLTSNRRFSVNANNDSFYSKNNLLINSSNSLIDYPIALTEVDIPEGVQTLTNQFYNGVTKIKISASVETIRNSPFRNCSTLQSIEVAQGNTKFKSANGILTSLDGKTLIAYPVGNSTAAIIPNIVDSILFGGITKYCKLILNNATPPALNGWSTNYYVYVNSSDIDKYKSANGWRSFNNIYGYDFIADSTLYVKNSEEEVSLVTCLKQSMPIIIPETAKDNSGIEYSVTGIGVRAYYSATMSDITIPACIKSIGNESFADCQNLRYVYVEGTPATIMSNSFSYGWYKTIYVPSELVGEYQSTDYWNNMNITANDYSDKGLSFIITSDNTVSVSKCLETRNNWEIPNEVTIKGKTYTVTSIGESAFSNNRPDGVMTIKLPNNLESIGNDAFRNCDIEEIRFPQSLKSIGSYAFYGCYNLKSLELPISLESIGNYAFSWLNKIESIVLKQNKPISLESSSAFPSDMKFIVTPASTITAYKSDAIWKEMNVIGADALVDNLCYKKLNNNTVAVVGSINSYNPYDNYSLTIPDRISISGTFYTVATIADSSFYNNLPRNIIIPTTVDSIGKYALYYQSSEVVFHVKNKAPAAINEDTFWGYDRWDGSGYSRYYNAQVIVEPDALESYKAAEIWKEIRNLTAYDAIIDSIGYTILSNEKVSVSKVFTTDSYKAIEIPKSVTINEKNYSVAVIGEGAFNDAYAAYAVLPESIDSITDTYSGNIPIIYLKATTPPKLSYDNYSIIYVPTESLGAYQENNLWTNGGYNKDYIIGSDGIIINDSIVYNIHSDSSTTDLCLWKKTQADVIEVPTVLTTEEGKSYTIIALNRRAFSSNSAMTFKIPSTITAIGEYAFPYPRNNEMAIYCDATTPPAIENQGYTDRFSLYVQSSAYNKYRTADIWKDFLKIIALDETDGILLYAKTSNTTSKVIGIVNKNIKNVVVPPTITIDRRALSVTEIANSAFEGCQIDTISLPNGIETIGDKAFFNCSSLCLVNIPSTTKKIGERAFYYCNLSSITIPASVEAIGEKAFSANYNNRTIQARAGNNYYKATNNQLLSKDGKTLIQASYSGLNNYTTVNGKRISLLAGVESILPGALERIGTSELYLPASLKKIDGEDLAGISSIRNIYIDEDNPDYCSIDGIVFSRDTTKIIYFPYYKAQYSDFKDYELPEKVRIIGKYAFSGARFNSLSTPDNLTTIEDNAFVPYFYDNGRYNSTGYTSSIILSTETPPAANEAAFVKSGVYDYTRMYSNTTLYVPMGTLDAYSTTKPWSNFLNLNSSKLEEEDFQILKAFYSEMNNGKGWYYSWTFGETAEETKMMRGMRMKDGHVTSLNLSSYGLNGPLSNKLFLLPAIESLDFSNNNLSGDIDSTLNAESINCKTLSSLNLSNNKMTGNIGIIGSTMPNLTSLNVSYNKFSDVVPVLPSKIYNLNINSQNIDKLIDYQSLAGLTTEDMLKKIPTLLIYNHSFQTYNTAKTFVATDQNTQKSVSANISNYGVFLQPYNKNYLYNLPNGTTMSLYDSQTGHSAKLTISFNMGDVDFSNVVDIADLQKTVDYAVEKPLTELFNFTAADIQTDEWVNVQDVVSLVNIIIDQDITNNVTNGARNRAMMNDAEATLYWRDNQLVLRTDCDISAMDIAIAGANDLRWLLNDVDYDYNISRKDGYIRVIHYSIAGKAIKPGETVLAVANGAVGILKADLIDLNAKFVKTSIMGEPTGIEDNTSSEDVIMAADANGVVISTTKDLRKTGWMIYSISGALLGKGTTDLSAGSNTLDCNLAGETQVIVRLSGDIINSTMKISVTK